MNWLEKLLNRPVVEVVKYKVVEVESPRTPFQVDKATQESIATLSSHPGFVALMHKCAYVNAALKTKLAGEHHKDLREVDFLQAGIYWSNWLLMESRRSTTKLPQKISDAFADEESLFGEVDAHIERVGE